MKILHINTFDRGGAAIAAIRLHKALLKNGEESDMLFRYTDGEIDRGYSAVGCVSFWYKFLRKLKLPEFWFYPLKGFLYKLYNGKTEVLSYPYSPYRLENHPLVRQADIIHLHWIGDFVDYPTFFKRLKKPVVWTVHDKNPFLGLCHLQLDQQRNVTDSRWMKYERKIQLHKKRILNERRIYFVSPSLALAEFGKACIPSNPFVQIPNLLSTTYESLLEQPFEEKETRNFRIGLFGFKVGQYHKGGHLIPQLLIELSRRNIACSVFGGDKSFESTNLDNVQWIPGSYEEKEVVKFYKSVDAILITSLEENLPNVMLEAFATGVPIVSFAVGGMKQYVVNGVTGRLAQGLELSDLINAVDTLRGEHQNYSQNRIRQWALQHFSSKVVIEQYNQVYQQILNTKP